MNPYTAFKNLSCFFSDSDYTNGGMEKRNWVNAVIITENPGAQISSSIHPRSGKWYSSEQQCVQACEEMTERVRGILVLDPRGWTVEALLELRLYELKGLLWDRFGPRLCRDKRPYRLFSKPNFDEAMSRFALREFGEVVKPPNHQITKKSLAKVLSFAAKRYSPVQLCQSAGIPETVELELPPFVLDQGSSPTCTSNAIAAAVLMLQANKVAKIHALSGGTDDGLSIVKGLETFSTKMISPNDGFRYHYIENDIGKIRLALSQGMPCIVSIEDFKNVAEFDGKKKLYSLSNKILDSDIWSEEVTISRESVSFLAINKQGEAAQAVPYLRQAVVGAPQSPGHHYHLGTALLMTGSRKQGRQELEAALHLASDFDGASRARTLLGE